MKTCISYKIYNRKNKGTKILIQRHSYLSWPNHTGSLQNHESRFTRQRNLGQSELLLSNPQLCLVSLRDVLWSGNAGNFNSMWMMGHQVGFCSQGPPRPYIDLLLADGLAWRRKHRMARVNHTQQDKVLSNLICPHHWPCFEQEAE